RRRAGLGLLRLARRHHRRRDLPARRAAALDRRRAARVRRAPRRRAVDGRLRRAAAGAAQPWRLPHRLGDQRLRRPAPPLRLPPPSPAVPPGARRGARRPGSGWFGSNPNIAAVARRAMGYDPVLTGAAPERRAVAYLWITIWPPEIGSVLEHPASQEALTRL